jgi:hypothetical protein
MRVEATPPEIPAKRCSYLTWLNTLDIIFGRMTEEDPPVVVVLIDAIYPSDVSCYLVMINISSCDVSDDLCNNSGRRSTLPFTSRSDQRSSDLQITAAKCNHMEYYITTLHA